MMIIGEEAQPLLQITPSELNNTIIGHLTNPTALVSSQHLLATRGHKKNIADFRRAITSARKVDEHFKSKKHKLHKI